MVTVERPEEYELVGFRRSSHKHKKYDGIIQHKMTKRQLKIPFGDRRYQQFRDQTPLKLYSHLDHNDLRRRHNYLARHSKTSGNKYSSSWFSKNYLW
jgi:hypothetical protein